MQERARPQLIQTMARTISALLVCCLAAVCVVLLPSPSGAATTSSDPQWTSADFTVTGLPANTGVDVKSVSCVTTTCFSVGTYANGDLHTFVAVSDGAGWTGSALDGLPSNNGEYPQSISCSSLTSCVVAGSFYDLQGNEVSFASVYDGTTWATTTLSPPSGITQIALKSVSCVLSLIHI